MILKFRIIILFFYCFICLPYSVKSQKADSLYSDALVGINKMLNNDDTLDFKNAVFFVENAYYNNGLKEESYNNIIKLYTSLSNGIIVSDGIAYSEKDRNIAQAQCTVFTFMTDSLPIAIGDKVVAHPPFSYNHEDFAGQKDWSNMFVSTLMQTQKGNCHSLPYFYKMIMDKLGYECHLALAPNHIYIKAHNKKVGWYNIELTCADFPTDAWYAASGYIHTDAVRNGIYMRALSDKEAVTMTLVDLAQGYQAKFGIGDGGFILKCCDTALEHFPNYINAMLLKAEILTALYQQEENETEQKIALLSQMNELYTTIHKLGYRKMPQQMYLNWVNSLNVEDRNQGIKAILNTKTK